MNQHRLSLLALLLLLCAYMASVHFYQRWNREVLGGGDPWGYYLYLPAIFIHHDLLHLEQSLAARERHNSVNRYSTINPLGVDEVRHVGEGRQVNKYTLGVALLFAPFFFIAHFIAGFTDYPADGYSFIYAYCIILSSVFYTLLGLFFLRSVLLRYVNDLTTAIVLIIIGLGTNLYFFTVINGPMSHAYLFCLYALLMYATERWYARLRLPDALLVGATAGLITLIRPTEILCIFIPLLWGIGSRSNFSARLALIRAQYPVYAAAAVAFVLMGLPQLFYWKYTTGHFFYYSYGEEGFNFLNPKIRKGLFSFKNGWLIYTPLMCFALAGIPLLWRRREYWLPILIILPLHIYITYSWWVWNYINGFGSRPMVQLYALLGVPLALLVAFAIKKRWLIAGLAPVFVLLTGLNLFHTWQFTEGMMWSQDATRAFYFGILGKTRMDYFDLVRYDSNEPQPDTNRISLLRPLFQETFEDSLNAQYTREHTRFGDFAYVLDNATHYSPGLMTEWRQLNTEGGRWLRVSVWCMRQYQGSGFEVSSMLTVAFERNGRNYKWRGLRLDNKPGNTHYSLWGGQPHVWEQVYFFVKIPRRVRPDDLFKVFAWNPTPNLIWLDQLEIELWK